MVIPLLREGQAGMSVPFIGMGIPTKPGSNGGELSDAIA
jgi:hypothetical protein